VIFFLSTGALDKASFKRERKDVLGGVDGGGGASRSGGGGGAGWELSDEQEEGAGAEQEESAGVPCFPFINFFSFFLIVKHFVYFPPLL
jgi:hypothetical protein